MRNNLAIVAVAAVLILPASLAAQQGSPRKTRPRRHPRRRTPPRPMSIRRPLVQKFRARKTVIRIYGSMARR